MHVAQTQTQSMHKVSAKYEALLSWRTLDTKCGHSSGLDYRLETLESRVFFLVCYLNEQFNSGVLDLIHQNINLTLVTKFLEINALRQN